MDIDNWLGKFKEYWVHHDVKRVLNLFHRDVEYYETPFQKLSNFSQLKGAWEGIGKQDNIKLDLKVYNKERNKYTVMWYLEYSYKNVVKKCAGTYLIELNNDNLCTYFFHCCENKL